MARKSRQEHFPTPATRELVQAHAMVGTPQEIIGKLLGVSAATLRNYYREELDNGLWVANAEIAKRLFTKAMLGDTSCMIFWLKTRAKWREKTDVNLTSDDGSMTPRVIERVIIDPETKN